MRPKNAQTPPKQPPKRPNISQTPPQTAKRFDYAKIKNTKSGVHIIAFHALFLGEMFGRLFGDFAIKKHPFSHCDRENEAMGHKHKKPGKHWRFRGFYSKKMVGAEGVEPSTFWSRN
ncbi:MAG: hypothetical protein PHU80_07785 [Kiritimatiellae bacterium]|nr:hypothetical protein [Kiritimatiellia bacterium]